MHLRAEQRRAARRERGVRDGARRRRGSGAARPVAPVLTLVVVLVVAGGLAGCGSSNSASATAAAETSLVRPPILTLQGCQYEVDNSIPAGEPKGARAPFGSFDPDPSAIAALQHIRAHGGMGVVDGFTLPAGTALYTGPAATAARAGVIPSYSSILVADPILWTDASGGDWLAFFLICGGNDLYWLSVGHEQRNDPAFGQTLAQTIAELRSARPYTKSGTISLLPVEIDGAHHLVWVAKGLTFQPARGQYLDDEA